MANLSARVGGLGSSHIRPQRYAFPVSASGNGRHLVDANGVAFPVHGRCCWVIFRLGTSAYQSVLQDTVAKGFTTIEMKTPVCPSVDNGDGKDQSGNLPFSKRLDGAAWTGSTTFSNINNEAPDFTFPVEAYWQSNDAFLNYCDSLGLLVCYFPAYVGYKDTDWWMNIMAANGETKMQTYGAWIANRYINQKNLVWMLGGDQGTGSIPFDSDELAAETGLINGLKSVNTASTLYSAEWLRDSITTDLFASSISLNGCYAAALEVNNQGSRARAIAPPKPAFYQEYPFEDVGSPGIMRRLMWWAHLSTIGGELFGNGNFAGFDDDPDYLSYMNTQGTQDAGRKNRFMASIAWQRLVPRNSAITAGGGTANTETQVACAVDPQGKLCVLYAPPSHTGTITIDMTVMSGLSTWRWFDPTNETFAADSAGLANTGTHVFTKPGNNNAGDADLVLVGIA